MEVRRTKQKDRASILDLPNDSLPPEIWDTTAEPLPRMHRELRSLIIRHARYLASKYKFETKAIFMYGSSATYQYTPEADIDISIYPVSIPEGAYEEILEKVREVHIPYKTFEIHYYLKKPDAPLAETADGSYDVLNDIWLIEPIKPEPGYDPLLDHEDMLEMADQRVGEFEGKIAQLNRYLSIIERSLAQEKYQEDHGKLQRRVGIYLTKVHETISEIESAVLSLKTRRDELHKTLKPGVVQDRFLLDEVIYKYLDSSGAYGKYEEALDRFDAVLKKISKL